jgi:hypothetical protein
MRAIHLSFLALAAACAEPAPSDDTGSLDTGAGDDADVDLGSSRADDPSCAEDYSLCGDLVIPADFSGTTRSLAVALYTSIPPAGPPSAILAEIDAPDLEPGARFPLVVQPVTAQGEYYLWLNLYMEGGGTWVPVNDIDYTGNTAEPLDFSGAPVVFDPIALEVASGW